ncbi:MAG TPA: YebC/PmpR family DNA-binding transcriptional regulator [Spirochaetia bacterium]|nr:YebC/PmpR family DNA-binding transcriptional regulator [Spirochaetia bacterium]
MSGHSKWATIKHKKGAADAKRGQMFTKIIKEMTIAARMGGGDAEANPRLRTAVLKARAANMPKENIERAIKKGTGELEGVNYVEMTYEGYAPGGVAIMINCLTDNKNRTAADVRSMLSKSGGNLGESGSVSYLFARKGLVSYDGDRYTEDQVLEKALEAGAEDVTASSGVIEVTTSPDDFETVLTALGKTGLEHESAEIAMIPDTYISLDSEGIRKVLRIVEHLEEHEDVQEVYTNLDIPDDFDPDAE